MHRRRDVQFAALGLALAACMGRVGPPPDEEPTDEVFDPDDPSDPSEPDADPNQPAPVFACEKGAKPQPSPLRRMTRLHFVATIGDITNRLAGDEAKAILDGLAPLFAKLPPDKYTSLRNKGRDGFTSADQTITQLHADAHVATARALAEALNQTEARRLRVWGRCATDADKGNDVTCVEDFIRKQGPFILRSRLTDADVAFYRSALRGTEATPAALGDVLALMLASPRAFFHVEEPNGSNRLTGWELANRLSFQLWDAPPDAELVAAVEDGSMDTRQGYERQVKRLLASPKATATMQRFFLEWFSLYGTPDLTKALGFKNYAALVGNAKPTAEAQAAMVDDVLGLVGDLYERDRPLMSFLTDTRVHTKEPFVRSIYGLSSDSTEELPPSKARAGLLTRPAFLASGDFSAHPILRGVRLRVALLCTPIGDPPANAITEAETTQVPSGPLGDRKDTELRTSPPGCAGCHRLFNPLGFATLNFDSLGRERSKEKVFDEQGKLEAELPIDTRVKPLVLDGDDSEVEGAGALLEQIVRSRKVEACVAAQYVRFSFGKVDDAVEEDGCLLRQLEDTARRGGTFKDLAFALVTSAAFTNGRAQ